MLKSKVLVALTLLNFSYTARADSEQDAREAGAAAYQTFMLVRDDVGNFTEENVNPLVQQQQRIRDKLARLRSAINFDATLCSTRPLSLGSQLQTALTILENEFMAQTNAFNILVRNYGIVREVLTTAHGYMATGDAAFLQNRFDAARSDYLWALNLVTQAHRVSRNFRNDLQNIGSAFAGILTRLATLEQAVLEVTSCPTEPIAQVLDSIEIQSDYYSVGEVEDAMVYSPAEYSGDIQMP